MASHKWWLQIESNAQCAFNQLPPCDKKAVFHSLEVVLNSENPCFVQGADVVSVKTQPGIFRLSVKDHRVFYKFEGNGIIMFGHVFKGTIIVTDILRRNEGTYRK